MLAERTASLTRRRLMQQGALGAAAMGVGFTGVEGVAAAADDPLPGLRRSTYESLTSNWFDIAGTPAELVSVEDLPAAAQLPALRERDDAFLLRFRGAQAAADAPSTIRHPDIGSFELFLSPLGDDGDLQAVVDRTVRLPTLDAQGAPEPQGPGPERAADVATAKAASTPGAVSPKRRAAVLRGAAIRRHGRRISADLAFAETPRLRAVRVVLLRNGIPVARTTGRVRHHRARLSFRLRHRAPAGAYELRIVAIDRRHRITRMTVPVTLPRRP